MYFTWFFDTLTGRLASTTNTHRLQYVSIPPVGATGTALELSDSHSHNNIIKIPSHIDSEKVYT